MKKMTCKQLGGACDKAFKAATFEEVATMSRKHAMEMFQMKDEAHLAAMNKMTELMEDPDAMAEWMSEKQAEFEALPDW